MSWAAPPPSGVAASFLRPRFSHRPLPWRFLGLLLLLGDRLFDGNPLPRNWGPLQIVSPTDLCKEDFANILGN